MTTVEQHGRTKTNHLAVWDVLLGRAGVPPEIASKALSTGRPSAGMLLSPRAARAGISSRVGGTPDTPADFRWPKSFGLPLTFLAQIRLSEVPSAVRDDLFLPSDGVLSFFYDTVEQPWGFDPRDRGGARVFFFPDISALARSSREISITEARFVENDVRFTEELSLPSGRNPALESLAMSDDDEDKYWSARDAEHSMRSDAASKLGGYADEIQRPMEPQCAIIARGLPLDDDSPVTEAVTANAKRWRLLFQLGSEDAAQMKWCDDGRLFFWIHEDQLKAGAFENAWCVLQTF